MLNDFKPSIILWLLGEFIKCGFSGSHADPGDWNAFVSKDGDFAQQVSKQSYTYDIQNIVLKAKLRSIKVLKNTDNSTPTL